MSEPLPPMPEPKDNRWIYWTLAGIAILLAVLGVIAYDNKQSEEAERLAGELTAKFEAAGLPVPADQDIIVAALGDDGGSVCANPGNSLHKALRFDHIYNGADFVGRRPIITDRRMVVGEALILETYCPDELEEFQDDFADVEQDDTIKD